MRESGSNPSGFASNQLSHAENQYREAVLAEPCPWAVIQGVVLALVIVNYQLNVLSWLLSTHDKQLEP